MATKNQMEQARKKKVADYKNAIDTMEKESEAFYKNELRRERISSEEYAKSLKERAERYKNYSNEVLSVSYMTEQEKLNLSKEYMLKSEEALTEHIERMKKLQREKLDSSMDNSSQYVYDRNYYSSWDEAHDDPVDAFKRVDEKLSKSFYEGTISYEEYCDRLKGFGTAMYEDRIANSERWLSHESKMNRISSEEYLAGLYRMQSYTQEYYSAGLISHREYIDGMQYLEEQIFNQKQVIHKEILKQAEEEKRAVDETAKAKISSLEAEYNATINAMDKAERDEDLSELYAQERIYKNSQTKEGKEKLSDIRGNIERLQNENKRAELKQNLADSKERILSSAERKKSSIDRQASRSAIDLGLYYNESDGYKMINDIGTAFNTILGKQQSFSQKSTEEINLYNVSLTNMMTTATQNLSDNILRNFSIFAAGVEAIKEQIFNDVRAVNSLDFSRFGLSSSPIKTTVTYNDYGDKNISTTKAADSFFGSLGNLVAKGVRI